MAIEIVDFPIKNGDLYGFGPENVGLIFPMIASHLKTG